MEAIAVVTILALMQFYLFGFQVGQMRAKHGIKAPATIGHPEFERMFRVQQNTMEQLVMFLPALWIFGVLGSPLWAAALGVVFIIGRYVYKRSYVADPSARGLGFALSTSAAAILMIGSLIYAGYGVYVKYLQ